MPRSNKKGRGKITYNEYSNDPSSNRASLEGKPNRKPLSTDEDNTSFELRDKKSLSFHKSKSKLTTTRKAKQSYFISKRGSLTSMSTVRGQERTSGASNTIEPEKRLLLLRVDAHEFKKTTQKRLVYGSDEDMYHDEEKKEEIEGESELGTDSEASMDDMDKLRTSFQKSAIYLEKQTSHDFFDILGDIPDIDNISLDPTIDEEPIVITPDSSKKINVDTGVFVDPLTGLEITSRSSSSTPVVEPEPSVYSMDMEESSFDLLAENTFEEDEELGQAYEAEEDKNKGKAQEDYNFGNWLIAAPSKMSVTHEFTQGIYDEHKRRVSKYILDFVNEIINKVVRIADLADPSRITKKALDKKKLMEDLNDKLRKLEIERKENFTLNKVVVEYFRRKHDYRGLKEDHPDEIKRLIEKNMELQKRLYESLYREEELQNISSVRISNLTAEVEAAEMVANQSVDNLEKIIKKAFCRDRFQYLNEVVLRSLKQMSQTRDAISNRRLVIVQRLHTLSKLKEKEDKLNDLGSGLQIQNFENLQAETTTLGTKVYEKEIDLNSLHIRRNKDLHVMTHLMENHTMIENTLKIKETVLRELLEEKQRAREEVNYQKMVRKDIRNEILMNRHQNGLAGNEALLLDYDKTVEELMETRARVIKMRHKHQQLEDHINRLEEQYNRASNIYTSSKLTK